MQMRARCRFMCARALYSEVHRGESALVRVAAAVATVAVTPESSCKCWRGSKRERARARSHERMSRRKCAVNEQTKNKTKNTRRREYQKRKLYAHKTSNLADRL